MSKSFADKVILVAGGTGGLGRVVSLAFLAAGAKVCVTYRRSEELEALKDSAAENVQRLNGYIVDVTDEAAVGKLIDEILALHRRLDALVNTVGGYAGGSNLWEGEAQVLEHMLALNLRSGYVLARAAVPAMLKEKAGSIVNTAGRAALDHGAGVGAYAASKAAALAMFDSLAAEVKGSGVRVNTILPDIIDTEANRRAMPAADFTKWTRPEDIARVILFLCSEDGRAIHGAAIPIYGSN